jgi:hypothetical protein
MKEETLRLIDDIVWTRNSDAREILDADYTFLNSTLAKVYGVAAPGTEWAKVTLPVAQNRVGFLGQGSFAARQSAPSRTSPTRRGLFVEARLLCNEIPPPPPGVNTMLPDPDPATPKTMKQRMVAHEKDPQCAGCHSFLDPIGFALEHFDAIGAYRTTDNGLPIDPTGEVQGLGSFDGPVALAALIRNDPRSAQCMIKNLYRAALGRLEEEGELPAIEALDKGFSENGYRIQDLLVELVASPAFRLVGPPK